MSPVTVIDLAYQALFLVLVLSLPSVVTASVVGITIGLLQAVTQIQDQSISHAAKLVTVAIVTALTVRWMGGELFQFGESMFRLLPSIGR